MPKRPERKTTLGMPGLRSSAIMLDNDVLVSEDEEKSHPLWLKVAGVAFAAGLLFFGLLFLGGAI